MNIYDFMVKRAPPDMIKEVRLNDMMWEVEDWRCKCRRTITFMGIELLGSENIGIAKWLRYFAFTYLFRFRTLAAAVVQFHVNRVYILSSSHLGFKEKKKERERELLESWLGIHLI